MGSIGTVSKINNSYQSTFGFANVGEREKISTPGGIAYAGNIKASTADVQPYLDTFKGYGTKAKKDIIKKITSDMTGRGYDVNVTEDGNYIQSGNTVIGISRNKDLEWKAKLSKSAGTKSASGMKQALRRASGLAK